MQKEKEQSATAHRHLADAVYLCSAALMQLARLSPSYNVHCLRGTSDVC